MDYKIGVVFVFFFLISFACAQEIKIEGNVISRGYQNYPESFNGTTAILSVQRNYSNSSLYSVNFIIAEVNLSQGWNLFTFTRNASTEFLNVSKNLSLGHNLIGFSANESADFSEIVRINGSSWTEAVSSGWVLNGILEFNPIIGFYNFLLPSLTFERNKGYVIYAREEGLNLTLEKVYGNADIEFGLQNLKVKNISSGDVYSLGAKADEWFYSSNISEIIYKHNPTKTNYTLVQENENLTMWQSYWIRSKVDNISLVIME